jgi:hypothetical protein
MNKENLVKELKHYQAEVYEKANGTLLVKLPTCPVRQLFIMMLMENDGFKLISDTTTSKVLYVTRKSDNLIMAVMYNESSDLFNDMKLEG